MADSEVTTPSLAEILCQHGSYEPYALVWSCRCGASFHEDFRDGVTHTDHLAAVLLASFVVVPKGQLHQEWAATCDQWRGGRTVRGSRDAALEDAVRATTFNKGPYSSLEPPSPSFEDMRIEARLVGPWRPAEERQR